MEDKEPDARAVTDDAMKPPEPCRVFGPVPSRRLGRSLGVLLALSWGGWPAQAQGQAVRLWDTGRAYTQKNPVDQAWKDKAKWMQVPHGRTAYPPRGDLILEGATFYLFLFSNKDDSVDLMAKMGDTGYKPNEIYKVHEDERGARNFGHGTLSVKILKHTAEEIAVEHAGQGAKDGEPVITVYRLLAKKPWLEVKPVERVNQQGMHGKSRLCAFVKKEGGDFILDSKREPFSGEVNVPAPEGAIGIINFNRGYRGDYDFMWFLTFPPGVEKHPLTYLGFHADPFWEDPPRPDQPSVGAQYAYLGPGGVLIGVLNDKDNWKREDVGREIQAGETYTTQFKAPYAGEWKLVARFAGKFAHRRVKIARAGQPFTFRSPADGTLDYVLVYLWDRAPQTPKSLWTPMDVYREAIEGPQKGGKR
jgi:hypothetical protein